MEGNGMVSASKKFTKQTELAFQFIFCFFARKMIASSTKKPSPAENEIEIPATRHTAQIGIANERHQYLWPGKYYFSYFCAIRDNKYG